MEMDCPPAPAPFLLAKVIFVVAMEFWVTYTQRFCAVNEPLTFNCTWISGALGVSPKGERYVVTL